MAPDAVRASAHADFSIDLIACIHYDALDSAQLIRSCRSRRTRVTLTLLDRLP
jgi:hypothetical protein